MVGVEGRAFAGLRPLLRRRFVRSAKSSPRLCGRCRCRRAAASNKPKMLPAGAGHPNYRPLTTPCGRVGNAGG